MIAAILIFVFLLVGWLVWTVMSAAFDYADILPGLIVGLAAVHIVSSSILINKAEDLKNEIKRIKNEKEEE